MVGSNLTILDQIAKFFLLLSDAPLMGFLLTDTAKPNAEGSTTRDKGGGLGGGSKVLGSSAPLFNDTKWDVGEGTDTRKIRLIAKKNL
jgi:hypothetical protein